MAKRSRQQIRRDEEQIILQLQQNARENIDQMAKNLGFSRQKIWRVINRLEEDQKIWGYTAVVDEERLGLKHFIALIKRTQVPVDQQIIQKVPGAELDDFLPDTRVKPEESLYVHGSYDLLVSFYVKNIVEAKQFCERLNQKFHGYIASIELLETLVPIRKHGIKNPDQTKLKDFW